ncbi:MAG: peptidylprolyl isomerase [Bacteriovoracaceae bacterium]|nr:peptidylprolyl isomerase [Bacteriovoracaceae bacterium]
MKIEKDMVVSINYTLTDNDGTQLDSSEGQAPLVYLQGHQNIIPGLEAQLEGKTTGDKLKTTIAPADAYGELNPELVQEVPRDQFEDSENLQVGMQFEVGTDAGPMLLSITELTDTTVTVDGNHPLAGVTLNFDVEVIEIRKATEEEVSHGHVHGAGGVQHD